MKKILSVFTILTITLQMLPGDLGFVSKSGVMAQASVSPIIHNTIHVYKTGSEPFDSTTWDGTDLTTAGYDEEEDNNVARLQDSITYKIEVSANDAKVEELTSTVVLNKKQAWIEIPTGCKTDEGEVSIVSSISENKRELFCNMGKAIEGTTKVFYPAARVIGASADGTEITLNDDRVSASVSSQGGGVLSAQAVSEDTVVTANFKIEMNKELLNTYLDPNTNEPAYKPLAKTGAAPDNREGSVMQYIVKAQYAKGSMIADSDEVSYESDYQIIDIYTDDNNNNNGALSTGGILYDWDPAMSACSLIGDHGDNATITCTQLNSVIDDLGAGGAAADGVNDPNIQVNLTGIDVRDPNNDSNLFEFQINIWFDKIDSLDSHQVCAGGGACINTVTNRVGVLNGSTVEGFNPVSTEDAEEQNLLNYNGSGEVFPNEKSYPLEYTTSGAWAAHLAFTDLFPHASDKYPDQSMAAGETRPFIMNVYDYRKIDGAESQLCNKVDTQVFNYMGIAPPFQTAIPKLYPWNNNKEYNPLFTTFAGAVGSRYGDAESLVDFYFTNIAYTADPVSDQAGYLTELRTAECNDDVNDDGSVVIMDKSGNLMDESGNITTGDVDWWMDASMVEPLGGGAGDPSNVTRIRQDMFYDATLATEQDPTHSKFGIAVNHLIKAKLLTASPYGTGQRLPHFMSHRRDFGDKIFEPWSHTSSTYEDPAADANFSIVPSFADRMTLVPSSHAIEKYTTPRGIKVVRGGDRVNFIVEAGVFGLWDSSVNTASVSDNLPTGTSYLNGSEQFSLDGGITWMTHSEYDASTPDITITSVPNEGGDDPLLWEFGNVDAGEQLPLIKYSVFVDPERVSGVFVNIATISSEIGIDHDQDGSSDDASARYQLTILPEYGFDVLKRQDKKIYEVNDLMTFDLVYKNLGGEDYTGGDFIDIFPHNADGTGNTGGIGSSRTPISLYNGSFTLTDISSSNGETFFATDADPSTIPQDPCHADNLPSGYIPVYGDLCYTTYKENNNTLPGGGISGTGTIAWNECASVNPSTCLIDQEAITALRFITTAVTAAGGGNTVTLEFTPTGNIGGEPDLDENQNVTDSSTGDIYTNTFGGRIPEISLITISNDVTTTIISGTIGNYVWADLNEDGVQDGTELPIEGVTLSIHDESGNPLYIDPVTGGIVPSTHGNAQAYTVTTDENGLYEFTNLPTGTYTIKVDQTTLPVGLTQTFDSDGTLDHESTHELILNAEGTDIVDNEDQDFGYFALPDVSLTKLVEGTDADTVYSTAEQIVMPNVNGNPDPTVFSYQLILSNESAIAAATNITVTDHVTPGVTITVASTSQGTVTTGLPMTSGSTPTDLDWVIPTLAPNETAILTLTAELRAIDSTNFTTYASTQSGKINPNYAEVTAMTEDDTDSTPNNGDTDSSNDEDDESSASVYVPPALGDYVWIDLNNNGVQDAGEEGLESVTVNLYIDVDGDGVAEPGGDDGSPVATTLTAHDGKYIFGSLDPNVPYFVEFDLTSEAVTNYIVVTPDQGGDDGTDTDADQTTGLTPIVTLASGEINDTIDMGVHPKLSIGNTVWNDANNNGIQELGELPIPNVTLTLLDSNGIPVPDPQNPGQTLGATTDANGNYLFSGLSSGDYTVQVDASNFDTGNTLENYQSSDDAVTTTDDDVDKNDDGITGPNGEIHSPQITLSYAGESVTDGDTSTYTNNTIDFGFFLPGSIGDYVWNDTNADGIQDATEVGIPNVTINLKDATGAIIGTTQTDTNGAYLFETLPAGSYTVEVDATTLPNGMMQSFDADGSLDHESTHSLTAGENNILQDFGYFETSSIGDTIYQDLDKSGTEDAGEPGIEGVTVTLTDADGNETTTTTDSEGKYLFEDLPAGDYTITITPPEGYEQTGDPDGPLDNESVYTLATGEQNETQDFGYFAPGSIGDTVYYDSNNNQMQDEGEEGIEGVIVTLVKPDGSTENTTTDATGNYLFENLPTGEYQILIGQPDGHFPTEDPDGGSAHKSTYNLAPGEENLDQDFGYRLPDPVPTGGGAKIYEKKPKEEPKPSAEKEEPESTAEPESPKDLPDYELKKPEREPEPTPESEEPLETFQLERNKDHLSWTEVLPKTGEIPSKLIDAYGAYSILEGESVHDPNYEALLALNHQGVMTGKGDSSQMASRESVNRAEAIKMLLISMESEIEKGSTSGFTDVPREAWYNDYVSHARSHNIVRGKSETEFDPTGDVTYGEMVKVIVEGFDLPVSPLNVSGEGSNHWAQAYLEAAQEANLIPDHLNNTDLNTSLTRGEVSILLYRSIMIHDNNKEAKIYEDERLISIPSKGIELPMSRSLPEHSSSWLQDLTTTGGAFYEDTDRDRLIVFAHSSVWGFDPTPYGPVFQKLIGGTVSQGETVSVTINGVPVRYEVQGSRLVEETDLKALQEAPGYETSDLIFFTCDRDLSQRWVYYAEQK